jgi:hypothetical protein
MSFSKDKKRAFDIWRTGTKATISQRQWEDEILSRTVYEILRQAAMAEAAMAEGANNDESRDQGRGTQAPE